jgi:hypothetical protein
MNDFNLFRVDLERRLEIVRLIDERLRLREDPSRRRELETACERLRAILCDTDDPGERP